MKVYNNSVSTSTKLLGAQGNLLVIPTFNCAPQIVGLMDSLEPVANHWDGIWFVDNGSTDGTTDQILNHLKIRHRFPNETRVLLNSENIGLGGTHKVSIEKAISSDYKTLTIFHGDHQANIQEALTALELIKIHKNSFLLGSRFSKTSKLVGYSRIRTLFNQCMNIIYSVVLSRRVYDLGSGLNIFPISSLKDIEFNKLPNDLTFNIEFLKWLVLNKKDIIWFPITWVETDQISNVKITKQVLKTFKLLFLPYGRMGSAIDPGHYQTEVKPDVD
jgi:dolichol-phosphate mannosyltransferase